MGPWLQAWLFRGSRITNLADGELRLVLEALVSFRLVLKVRQPSTIHELAHTGSWVLTRKGCVAALAHDRIPVVVPQVVALIAGTTD